MLGATYRTRKGSMGIIARTYDCKLLKPVEPLLKSDMTLAFEVFTLHLLHSHWSYASSGVALLEVFRSQSGKGTSQTTSQHEMEELG